MKRSLPPRVPVKALLSDEAAPLGLRLLGGKSGLKNLIVPENTIYSSPIEALYSKTFTISWVAPKAF